MKIRKMQVPINQVEYVPLILVVPEPIGVFLWEVKKLFDPSDCKLLGPDDIICWLASRWNSDAIRLATVELPAEEKAEMIKWAGCEDEYIDKQVKRLFGKAGNE